MAYISQYSGEELDDAVTSINDLLSTFIDTVYPIGSIYTSSKSTSPADLFGGTWIQIKDTFLLTAGDSYAAGSSGGSATHTHTSAAHTHTTAGHTLTVNEMPSHSHTNYYHGGSSVSWGYNYTSGGTVSSATPASGGIGYTGGGASHSHGNTGSTTPGNTGSSSNLPPYKVVYAWERTA